MRLDEWNNEMNTCKTCKHWKAWPGEISVGSCEVLGIESLDGADSDIRVRDDSLPITTEINFGCIHHC